MYLKLISTFMLTVVFISINISISYAGDISGKQPFKIGLIRTDINKFQNQIYQYRFYGKDILDKIYTDLSTKYDGVAVVDNNNINNDEYDVYVNFNVDYSLDNGLLNVTLTMNNTMTVSNNKSNVSKYHDSCTEKINSLGISFMTNDARKERIDNLIACVSNKIQNNLQTERLLLAKNKSLIAKPSIKDNVIHQVRENKHPEISTSDIDKLPTYTKTAKNNNYSVVIGIESYRQKLPRADYAVSDAKLVAAYLIKALGYQEENVITITNENATKSDLDKYLGTWLKNNVERDGTVFIYYSGHGAPNPMNGDAYLVPYDGDPTFIADTGYPLSRLYDNLAKLPAKQVVVVLDSCFSGAGGKSVLAKGARPLVMNMDKSQLPGQNIAVLAAASGDQISSSYEEKGHGVFTYFFLKGIKEQLEESKSAKVDLGNLYDYLKPKVERVSRKNYNTEQTPQLILGNESLRKMEFN